MPKDNPAVVLGIDPGLRICGWGLVSATEPASFIDCGVIKPKPSESTPDRLLFLNSQITALIDQHRPDEVAVEEPFIRSLTPTAVLALGQARAAVVMAVAEKTLPVEFYAPASVKATVTGYGQGDKRQVQAMVRLLLRLETEPQPADAADALAIAMCHLAQRRVRALEMAGSR